jgi:hypothetical protein
VRIPARAQGRRDGRDNDMMPPKNATPSDARLVAAMIGRAGVL